jgi:hypothetical protein
MQLIGQYLETQQAQRLTILLAVHGLEGAQRWEALRPKVSSPLVATQARVFTVIKEALGWYLEQCNK